MDGPVATRHRLHHFEEGAREVAAYLEGPHVAALVGDRRHVAETVSTAAFFEAFDHAAFAVGCENGIAEAREVVTELRGLVETEERARGGEMELRLAHAFLLEARVNRLVGARELLALPFGEQALDLGILDEDGRRSGGLLELGGHRRLDLSAHPGERFVLALDDARAKLTGQEPPRHETEDGQHGGESKDDFPLGGPRIDPTEHGALSRRPVDTRTRTSPEVTTPSSTVPQPAGSTWRRGGGNARELAKEGRREEAGSRKKVGGEHSRGRLSGWSLGVWGRTR